MTQQTGPLRRRSAASCLDRRTVRVLHCRGYFSTVEQDSAPCGMCLRHKERGKLPGLPGGACPASRRVYSAAKSTCQQDAAMLATC